MSDEESLNQLPKELEVAFLKSIQDLCFWLHDKTGASHIIIDVQHISDAQARVSQTLVSGAGLKMRLGNKEEMPDAAAEEAKRMANEAIERAIAQAKKKASDEAIKKAIDESEKKPEPPTGE